MATQKRRDDDTVLDERDACVEKLKRDRHQMVLDAIGEDEKTMNRALTGGGGMVMCCLVQDDKDRQPQGLLARCHERACDMVLRAGHDAVRNEKNDVDAMYDARRALAPSLAQVVNYYCEYFAEGQLSYLCVGGGGGGRTKKILNNRSSDLQSFTLPQKLALVHNTYALLLCADFDLHAVFRRLARKSGFDTSSIATRKRETALHRAARLGHEDMVRELVSLRKTTTQMKDTDGYTAEKVARDEYEKMTGILDADHPHLARMKRIIDILERNRKYVHSRSCATRTRDAYRAEGHSRLPSQKREDDDVSASINDLIPKRRMPWLTRRRHGRRNANLLNALK